MASAAENTAEAEGAVLGAVGDDAGQHTLTNVLLTTTDGSGQGTIHRVLRADLQAARMQRGADTEANHKYAAALGGNVTFAPIDDGSQRISVKFKRGRGEGCECVRDIPRVVLKAVLETGLLDPDPANQLNLKPWNMALVSSRTFWAVVRHGGVGPDRSFGEALQIVAPGHPEWDTIDVRTRTKVDKYKDHDSSSSEEDDRVSSS